jgi:hypothetical protein
MTLAEFLHMVDGIPRDVDLVVDMDDRLVGLDCIDWRPEDQPHVRLIPAITW